jgi:AraC-like DNA-binding protein/quercetin dioxygenase-like cupin family protein
LRAIPQHGAESYGENGVIRLREIISTMGFTIAFLLTLPAGGFMIHTMPKQKIQYKSGLPPISVEVMKVSSSACHWHEHLEVIWVLSGHIDLFESHLMYHLYAGDVFVVNYNEAHRLVAGSNAVLAFVHIDHSYFAKEIKDLKKITFAHGCFSKAPQQNDALANCHRFIITLYQLLNASTPSASTARKLDSMTVFFLKMLISIFQYRYYVKEDGVYRSILNRSPDLSLDQIQRLQRLTYHIFNNCNDKLNLDRVAETECYSRFYISHFIKKAFGLSFQETVCLSRVVMSERILLDTGFSIDEIATFVGFSNRSQYCNQFKRWHGIPPSQYRKENSQGASGNEDVMFHLEETLIREIFDEYERETARTTMRSDGDEMAHGDRDKMAHGDGDEVATIARTNKSEIESIAR